MKKLLVVLFALALIAMLPLTAFAAGGINEHEQEVLDKLEGSAVIGKNGWSFAIPQQYVNSAKNYFAGSCEMTAEQKTVILSYIDAGMATIKSDGDAQNFTGKEFSLSKMSDANRASVLKSGQGACAQVQLNLVYVPATNQVVITPMETAGAPVFESAPIIKVTGQEFAPNAGTVAIAVFAVIVLGSVAMLAVSKKKDLLV